MKNNRSDKLKQHSLTDVIKPKIKIVSSTQNPVGTLFTVWSGTRHTENVSAEDIQALWEYEGYISTMDKHLSDVAELICKWYPEHAGEHHSDFKNVIKSIVTRVIELNVPVSESVLLTIEISDANVAWREQLVRGRNTQQFWVTSSRTTDLSTMDVTMSESIQLFGGDEAVQIYKDTVGVLRDAYLKLTDLGVPMEDIRLQPQSHIERDYWMITLRTLVAILNKRADWIAQATLWAPVNAGILKELRRIGLYDIIKDYIGKPLVKLAYSNEYGRYYVDTHTMTVENEDRYYARDPQPCDPLWLACNHLCMPEHTNIEFYDYLKSMYIELWQDEYLEVLGWDRNDPTKIGKYDRPYSWFVANGREADVANLTHK